MDIDLPLLHTHCYDDKNSKTHRQHSRANVVDDACDEKKLCMEAHVHLPGSSVCVINGRI